MVVKLHITFLAELPSVCSTATSNWLINLRVQYLPIQLAKIRNGVASLIPQARLMYD